MHPLLQALAFDTPYRCGPQATTDLHAGGVFFCVVYAELLEFRRNGTVRRRCEVAEGARPLDDDDDDLRRVNESGSYRVNSRGYLEVSLPDRDLTGLLWPSAPELLAFHVYRPSSGVQFGQVYRRVGRAEV